MDMDLISPWNKNYGGYKNECSLIYTGLTYEYYTDMNYYLHSTHKTVCSLKFYQKLTIYVYEYEQKKNEDKRSISLVNPTYVTSIMEQFRGMFR